MITAPISSFNVSPPGPSCCVGVGEGDGAVEGALELELEGVGLELETGPGPPHEMSNAASKVGVSRLAAAPMCTTT